MFLLLLLLLLLNNKHVGCNVLPVEIHVKKTHPFLCHQYSVRSQVKILCKTEIIYK